MPSLTAMGHVMNVIGPADCGFNVPCPQYPEIRLSLGGLFTLTQKIDAARAKCSPSEFHLHIATEGPLGGIARRYAQKHGLIFSSCYHTEFPDYIAKRAPKFLEAFIKTLAIKFIKNFHEAAGTMFTATESLRQKLRGLNYNVPLSHLTRGVDHTQFYLAPKIEFSELPKPIALYVGRVAVEKNLEAFLNAKWHGTKVIVGDGPDRARLSSQYPSVVFTGKKEGATLADHFRSADIFVFPSRTDTFGMVLVEAMACGLPVAAYPVTGPLDIITHPALGTLHEDLSIAMQSALNAPESGEYRAAFAKDHYTWHEAARQFIAGITQYCIKP